MANFYKMMADYRRKELLCQGFTVKDSAKNGLGDMVLVPSPAATIILDGTDPWQHGEWGPCMWLGQVQVQSRSFRGHIHSHFLLFKEGSCKGASWGTSTAHQVLCEKPQPGKGWCLAGLAVLGILMRFMDRMLIDLFEQSQDLRFSTQVVPRRDWYGRIEWIYFPVSNPTEACWLFFARSQLA